MPRSARARSSGERTRLMGAVGVVLGGGPLSELGRDDQPAAAHRRCLVVMALDKHGVSDLGWGDPMRWVAEPRT